MRKAPTSDPQCGFSLIEALAALTLLMLLMGSVATTVNIVSLSVRKGAADINRIDMLSRAQAAIRTDMMRVERIVSPASKKRKANRFYFSGRRRTLTFVVREPDYPSDPGSYVITYRYRSGGGIGELVRSREPFDPGRKRGEGRKLGRHDADVVVLEGAYSVAFSYLGLRRGTTQWLSRWKDPKSLPLLLKMTFNPLDASLPAPPPLIVRPRINAEASCVDQKRRICSPRSGGRLVDASEADGKQAGGKQ